MSSVEQTTQLSINIQKISLLINFIGLSFTIPLPEQHLIIKDLLLIETLVQIIELAFYLIFLKNLSKNVIGMSKTRYYDWFITTPSMLLSSIIYFEYLYRIESNTSSFRFQDFVSLPDNQKNISFIFTANFLMLFFGYLYEIHVIDKKTATFFGYVFFLITFQFIYEKYAQKSKQGKQLFAVLFIIWAIYGIAFQLPDIEKNNITNFLDLFAKNFFGIFLVYQAVNLSRQS